MKRLKETHNDRIQTYGISACNFDDLYTRQSIHDGLFLMDAHDLSPNFEPLSLDIIVSSKTLIHLVDPIKAIENWFMYLKPGGWLVVDQFITEGLSYEDKKKLLAYIKSKSLISFIKVVDRKESNFMFFENKRIFFGQDVSSLILKKNDAHDTLNFPVERVDIDFSRVIYKLTEDIPPEESDIVNSLSQYLREKEITTFSEITKDD